MATVYLAQVINGTTTCLHLCEKCARERGILDPSGMPAKNLSDVCNIECKKTQKEGSTIQCCPHCGNTLSHFRVAKSVGCLYCYEAFRDSIALLVGKRCYGGKKPRQFNGSSATTIDRRWRRRKEPLTGEEKIRVLSAHLELAVTEERYEDAAQIRDMIATCEMRRGQRHSPRKSA
jgi:protein arginine kinase activator